MGKSACSLYVLSSASCDVSSPRMSDMGHAWVSIPSLNGLTMLRIARVEIHVCNIMSVSLGFLPHLDVNIIPRSD